MKRALSRKQILAVCLCLLLSPSPALAGLLTAGAEANVTSGSSVFPWAPPVTRSDALAPGLVLSQDLTGVLLPPFDVNGGWHSLAIAQYGALSTRATADTSGPLGYGAQARTTASWQDGLRIEGGTGSGVLWLSLDLHAAISDPGGLPIASGFSLTSDACPSGCTASWGVAGTIGGNATYDDTRLALIPFQFGVPFTIAGSVFASASAFGAVSTDVLVDAIVREAYVTNEFYTRMGEALIYADSGTDYAHVLPMGAAPAPAGAWLLLLGAWAFRARRRTR